MCMVKVCNSTHPSNLWIISKQRSNSTVRRQCCMRRSNEGRIHQKRPYQAYTPEVLLIQPRAWKWRKLIFSISDQVIMWQISLQRHFPLQLSESLFMILGCVICETYEEELLISTWGGAYVAALFFPYYVFVPQGFPSKVFNEAV